MSSYIALADRGLLEKTIAAIEARGIMAELAETRSAALSRLKELIPAGSTVMTGASATLREIGFEAAVADREQGWNYLKPGILAERDPATQLGLRRRAALADYYVGSIQALTETGEIVAASGSGSQLAAYAYSSAHILWVVGAQKSSPTSKKHCGVYASIVFPKLRRWPAEWVGPSSGCSGSSSSSSARCPTCPGASASSS